MLHFLQEVYLLEQMNKESMKRRGEKTLMKAKIQKLGRFMSGMVMPNIAVLICWGLYTALFLVDGGMAWMPNEKMAQVISPMLTYLIPLLFGYTGGKMVYGTRGGLVGAIATMGVIVGGGVTMFLGAMIVGLLGAWCMKKVDRLLEKKVPSGFEMLVNNFSAGILGVLLLIICYLVFGPVVTVLTNGFGNAVKAIVDTGFLPLTSILIEPAKILFMNNAIQYGVLTPLGLEQAAETGKSIYFILEGNLGPGLGVILACWVFGKGTAKAAAPGAAIIQFFGGIHEIYFPYVLAKPMLLLSVIGGGMAGIATNQMLGSGLVAAACPGSIFAYILMSPKGGVWKVLLGILAATIVSFLISAIIYKKFGSEEDENIQKEMEVITDSFKNNEPVKKMEIKAKCIYFACDAGMGSSAMAAARLTNKFNKNGIDIRVKHTAVDDIPKDAEIVITHKALAERAGEYTNARIIAITDFMNAPEYDELIEELK